MNTSNRLASFIDSYDTQKGELESIYCDAIERGIPVIRRDTRDFLKCLILLKKPYRILELGTAIGYSSLFMSQYILASSTITTVELDMEHVIEARHNIKKFHKEDIINVICGDALQIMKDMSDDQPFDFIFMDAAKAQYIRYLPEAVRLLCKDGILITDNVLQEGEILESHFTVEKRNKTIHDRMRQYLFDVTRNDELETSILSVGDGVTFSIKK